MFHLCPAHLSAAQEGSICYSVWSALVGVVNGFIWHQLWAPAGLCLNIPMLFSLPSIVPHSAMASSKAGEEGWTIRCRALTIMIRRRTDAECNSHFSLLCYCSYGLAVLLALANTIHFISCFSCWLGSHPPLGSCSQTPGWLH